MSVGTLEFIPRSYGRRLTLLFAVRTIAILCVAVAPICHALAAVVWHGKQFRPFWWVPIIGAVFAGMLFQILAIVAWRRPDLRKITWNPQTAELTFSDHRFVGRFFSFGRLRKKERLALHDIQDVRLVRGRGQYLRLHTRHGFVCVANDLQPFDQLNHLLTTRQRHKIPV